MSLKKSYIRKITETITYLEYGATTSTNPAYFDKDMRNKERIQIGEEKTQVVSPWREMTEVECALVVSQGLRRVEDDD